MPTLIDCPKCRNLIDLEQDNCPYCGWSTIEDDSPPGAYERTMRWLLIASNVVLAVALAVLFLDLFEKGKTWTIWFFSIAAACAVLGNLVALSRIRQRQKLANKEKDPAAERPNG